MITINNDGTIIAHFYDGSEAAFTNNGIYTLDGVAYVVSGSNQNVGISNYHSGAVVTCDSYNVIKVQDGPRVVESLSLGFATGLLTVGLFLSVKGIISRFMRATGVNDYD